MTDSRHDDTQRREDPDWSRAVEVPRIRSDDTGGVARTTGLGQLVRDVSGGIPRAHARSFERTRAHHVVTSRPIERHFEDTTDDWALVDHWLEPEPNRRPTRAGIDPTLLRLGAAAAVGVLMIPVALALREEDGELRADEAAAVTTALPQPLAAPATTVATIPPTAAPVQAAIPAIAGGDSAAAIAAPVAGLDEPSCAGIYTVIPNDFWNRFPKSSGVSVEEWLAANDATADTPLYVGDELCIPAGATAPAPPSASTVPPTTAVPAMTVTPAPTPVATQTPPPVAPVAVVAQSPAPPRPVVTTPPAPIPSGAASTESLCGTLPTSNGNPSGTPGPATVEALIREIWPDDLEVRALCIAKREARLRADVNNWCCYGVFALYFDYVSADLRATFGVDEPSDLYDARTNIAIAYQVYLRGGWDPWSQTDPGAG